MDLPRRYANVSLDKLTGRNSSRYPRRNPSRESRIRMPVLAGPVDVGVWRDLDGRVGLIGLTGTPMALPAVS